MISLSIRRIYIPPFTQHLTTIIHYDFHELVLALSPLAYHLPQETISSFYLGPRNQLVYFSPLPAVALNIVTLRL